MAHQTQPQPRLKVRMQHGAEDSKFTISHHTSQHSVNPQLRSQRPLSDALAPPPLIKRLKIASLIELGCCARYMVALRKMGDILPSRFNVPAQLSVWQRPVQNLGLMAPPHRDTRGVSRDLIRSRTWWWIYQMCVMLGGDPISRPRWLGRCSGQGVRHAASCLHGEAATKPKASYPTTGVE